MKRVKCLSETCNGRIIAFLDDRGRIKQLDQPRDNLGRLAKYNPDNEWLLAYVAAPGYTGFQCKCGNDCRESGAENNFLIED